MPLLDVHHLVHQPYVFVFQTCEQEMPLLDNLLLQLLEVMNQFQTCEQEMPLLDPEKEQCLLQEFAVSNLRAGNAPFRQKLT